MRAAQWTKGKFEHRRCEAEGGFDPLSGRFLHADPFILHAILLKLVGGAPSSPEKMADGGRT